MLKEKIQNDVKEALKSGNAGKKVVSYALAATVPAVFQSNSSERRVAPYIENIDEFQFYISHQHAQYVAYDNRILTVKDRYNNSIVTGKQIGRAHV